MNRLSMAAFAAVLMCRCGGDGTPTSPGPTPAPVRAEVVEILGISNGATSCGGTVGAGRLVEIKFVYASREIVAVTPRVNGAKGFRNKPVDFWLPPSVKSVAYYGVSCPVRGDGSSPCDRGGQPLTTTTLGVTLTSPEGLTLDSKEIPCQITWMPSS